MLDKKYNHLNVENGKYDFWLKNKYFEAGKDIDKIPFTIVIPPPNVTGKLHLGHAWDTTLQDIIIRYKKMCGYDALWLPGMDHAGIATQAKVDKKLKDMGINPRDMDREEWLKVAWDWKEEYAQNIQMQGITLEQFYQFTGLTEEKLKEEYKDQATKRVTYRLMIDEIIKKEKIEVTDKEVDEEVSAMAEKYQMTKEDFMKSFGEDMIKHDLRVRKVFDILKGEKE